MRRESILGASASESFAKPNSVLRLYACRLPTTDGRGCALAHAAGQLASDAPARCVPARVGRADRSEISLVLILGVLLANVLIPPVYELSTRYTPAPSWHLVHRHSRFLFLSFKLADGNLHYKGRDDAYLISFWVLAFWFLREASMRWFWAPLARRCGVKEGKAVVRFSEQGWSLLYCASTVSRELD